MKNHIKQLIEFNGDCLAIWMACGLAACGANEKVINKFYELHIKDMELLGLESLLKENND